MGTGYFSIRKRYIRLKEEAKKKKLCARCFKNKATKNMESCKSCRMKAKKNYWARKGKNV